MCGIYGFTGIPTKQTSGIIKRLGELNQARGRDSTGLAFIGLDEAIVYKNNVEAHDFFKDQKVIEHLCNYRKKDFATILGHTRFATHGDITAENAHPFNEQDIFFTHNGVISNFYELRRKYDLKYHVDSQVIGYLLNKSNSVLDAYKELQGSFTVPYVNLKEIDTLKVAVHNQVFSYAIRGNQLYYSSDIDDLREALMPFKGFNIIDAKRDIEYSFYPSQDKMIVNKMNIETKPYEKIYSYPNYYGMYGSDYDDMYNDGYRGYGYQAQRSGSATIEKTISNHEWERTHDKYNRELSSEEIAELQEAEEAELLDETEKQYLLEAEAQAELEAEELEAEAIEREAWEDLPIFNKKDVKNWKKKQKKAQKLARKEARRRAQLEKKEARKLVDSVKSGIEKLSQMRLAEQAESLQGTNFKKIQAIENHKVIYSN